MDRRNHDDDEDDDVGDQRTAPFSRRERRLIREMMDREGKARWLAATIRAWGAWIAAILVALMAFSDNLRKLFKGWLS